MLIAKAKYYEKTQKKIAEKLGILPSKFADMKSGRLKPTAYEIIKLAELAHVDEQTALYAVMAETDKEHKSFWSKKLAHSAGIEPAPQASEAYNLMTRAFFAILSLLRLHILKHSPNARIASLKQYPYALVNP